MSDARNFSEADELDYWRTPSADKLNPATLPRLQQWAESHQNLSHFSLRRCELSGIDLSRNEKQKHGYNLSDADLYRCDLSHAHLYAVDFSNANLMKANLSGANLHDANLDNANLLGIRLKGAKLDNVHWGSSVIQEQQADAAKREGDTTLALDLYQQAEETYRNLRINLEQAGLFETAGQFFHREMVMRRKRLPTFSSNRSLSLLVDLFCGYGEKPFRVVAFSLVFIVICAAMFFLTSGINYQGQLIGLNVEHALLENGKQFIDCLYFSVVTFTTLGYGDITPVGSLSRIVAAVEAFVGSFTLALFVVVFVKKMTR